MTKDDLIREREALDGLRDRLDPNVFGTSIAALTASIARIDALLSLSDEQCEHACDFLRDRARAHEENAAFQQQKAHVTRGFARALRTVADLVRRS
jgi:hypothetical protein